MVVINFLSKATYTPKPDRTRSIPYEHGTPRINTEHPGSRYVLIGGNPGWNWVPRRSQTNRQPAPKTAPQRMHIDNHGRRRSQHGSDSGTSIAALRTVPDPTPDHPGSPRINVVPFRTFSEPIRSLNGPSRTTLYCKIAPDGPGWPRQF